MAYIKITNGAQEPYSIGKLRRDNNNVSFPKVVPDNTLADYGVYPVTTANRPSIDEKTQNASVNSQATLINGQWTYQWTVSDKTAEELQAIADKNASSARAKRDGLLAETDWVVIRSVENPGNPISVGMKAYRQALRDLDQQAGWPANITWPTKPV